MKKSDLTGAVSSALIVDDDAGVGAGVIDCHGGHLQHGRAVRARLFEVRAVRQ